MTVQRHGPGIPRWREPPPAQYYVLRLFVTGGTRLSLRAVENVNRLCERHFPGQYDLEVVDIYQFPAHAATAQLVAAPTLVKEFPLPPRRLIGDMTDEAGFLDALGLPRCTLN